MNGSLPEEASKVATTAIDAMRTSPALLAVIIMQMATLVVSFYLIEQQRSRAFEREKMLIERCMPGDDNGKG